MQRLNLAGVETSRIGFGCGRLVGGAAMRSSARIVEAARELGICHFDTAPSYGLGTADDVLGSVLNGDASVTIVTKVGQVRPGASGLKTLARQLLRPVLSLAPGIKARLARHAGGGATPNQFTAAMIEQSCADSLERLRTSRVAGVLLHEIHGPAISGNVAAAMHALQRAGMTAEIGSGTGEPLRDLVPFGTISQYRWQPDILAMPAGFVILHGVLRHFPRPAKFDPRHRDLLAKLGRDSHDPAAWSGTALTYVLASQPGSILLVSSTSAVRLRQAVTAIDWSVVERCSDEAMADMRNLLT